MPASVSKCEFNPISLCVQWNASPKVCLYNFVYVAASVRASWTENITNTVVDGEQHRTYTAHVHPVGEVQTGGQGKALWVGGGKNRVFQNGCCGHFMHFCSQTQVSNIPRTNESWMSTANGRVVANPDRICIDLCERTCSEEIRTIKQRRRKGWKGWKGWKGCSTGHKKGVRRFRSDKWTNRKQK